MPNATCRLCHKDAQFPEQWLLYSSCGHASCELCAKGSLSACPICHASTLGRPPIRILSVQVNDVPRLAERDAEQRQLENTIRLLEDKLRLLNEEQQLLQILGMESLLHEMGKMQESARACATRDAGGPPGAANAPQSSTTVTVQRGLINWDEAHRLLTRLKDEVIVLTPTWQASGDLQRPFLYFSLFVLYAMAAFLCVVMYALLEFRCTTSCPGYCSTPDK
ncbi:hypothetical protein FB107DRAFT_277016 [Schizophyllum commune]